MKAARRGRDARLGGQQGGEHRVAGQAEGRRHAASCRRSPQLKADMKKVGDTMLKEWLDKAGAEGKAAGRRLPQVTAGAVHVRRLLDALYDGAAWAGGAVHGRPAGDGAAVHRQPAAALPRAGHRRLCRLPDGRRPASWRWRTRSSSGEHIRVTLLLSHLHGGARRGLEIWALAAATALAGLSALLQLPAGLAVAHLQRHLHRQRRHAAVDPAAGDGRWAR